MNFKARKRNCVSIVNKCVRGAQNATCGSAAEFDWKPVYHYYLGGREDLWSKSSMAVVTVYPSLRNRLLFSTWFHTTYELLRSHWALLWHSGGGVPKYYILCGMEVIDEWYGILNIQSKDGFGSIYHCNAVFVRSGKFLPLHLDSWSRRNEFNIKDVLLISGEKWIYRGHILGSKALNFHVNPKSIQTNLVLFGDEHKHTTRTGIPLSPHPGKTQHNDQYKYPIWLNWDYSQC